MIEPVEPRQYLSFAAHINFQPASAAVPAGYVADAGNAYAARGNGLTYGWTANNLANAIDRNSDVITIIRVIASACVRDLRRMPESEVG